MRMWLAKRDSEYQGEIRCQYKSQYREILFNTFHKALEQLMGERMSFYENFAYALVIKNLTNSKAYINECRALPER